VNDKDREDYNRAVGTNHAIPEDPEKPVLESSDPFEIMVVGFAILSLGTIIGLAVILLCNRLFPL